MKTGRLFDFPSKRTAASGDLLVALSWSCSLHFSLYIYFSRDIAIPGYTLRGTRFDQYALTLDVCVSRLQKGVFGDEPDGAGVLGGRLKGTQRRQHQARPNYVRRRRRPPSTLPEKETSTLIHPFWNISAVRIEWDKLSSGFTQEPKKWMTRRWVQYKHLNIREHTMQF